VKRTAIAMALFAILTAAYAVPPSPVPLERAALQTLRASSASMLAVKRAGARLVAAGERGIVLVSDDGGASWRQAQVPVQVTLTALHFADPRNGWAVGHMGVVLATSDGGLTWRKQLDGVRAAQLIGSKRLIQEGPDKPFFDIDAADAKRAIVVGAYGLAFETSDGGDSWKPLTPRLPNPKNLHLYGVRLAGANVYIAGEQGLLIRSSDQGASFAALPSPYNGSFFGLLASRSGILVAYGLRGNAFRSADEGRSWDKIETATSVSFAAAIELPVNALALLNQAGQVLISRDDAHNFTPLALPPSSAATAALARGNDGSLVFATTRGMRVVSAP
jgi:photosystem II stability/assembly factor-like uncharacterized protein